MDAVQTNIKKFAFFLATALLLTAPFHAYAQTLAAGSTSVNIGNSSCNDSQTILLSSTGAAIPFTVSVNYPNGTSSGDNNGQWLYATVSGSGSTSSGSTFSANTGTAGVTLTVGLERTIGAATDTAQVIVTDINNPKTDVLTITVYYAQNSSCGGNTGSTSNGFITVTPGSITLNASTTGQQSQAISIQNTTGSGMTFGFSVSPTNSWLSVTATTTTISANGGTASLNVIADATKTAGVGTYSGVVTIQPQSGFGTALTISVTFTVGNGGGGGSGSSGTLTLNGTSSNTYTTSFSVAPNVPAGQCVPLLDTASGANSYYYQVSTMGGGNWLLADNNITGTTTHLLGAGYNACINLTLSNVANTLASGAYQGSVAITSSSGSTATIYVNLYVSGGAAPGISVSPSLVYVFPNVAVNGNVVQQEVFSITAASGYALGVATLSSGSASGFSMTTPIASNGTETFTLTANSSGLTTGVYAAVITIQSSGTSAGTTTITAILPVGQSGATTTGTGGGTSAAAPLSLYFQQQAGTSFWTSGQEAQTISITGAQGAQWNASIIYGSGSNWLNFDSPVSASGTFGTGPASLVVDLFNGVSTLQASSTPYTATVNITTASGTTIASVAVSLLVTPANTPVLLGKPASATFSSSSTSTPANISVTVVGSDNTTSTFSPAITVGTPTASWITATASGNNMSIGANPSSLSTGIYSGTIPVTASAYNNTLNYPVVLIVNGGGGGSTSGGPLTLSTTALNFANVTSQTSQTLNITATGTTNFTAVSSESTCTASNWLLSINSSYTASTTVTPITVMVNPAGIANGTSCTGVITLVSSTATQTVNVTMTVGSTAGSGNVTVSPLSMTFSYTQSQAVPAAQTATVVNATSGTASIAFTVAVVENNGTSVTWLQTNVTSASTPYNSPGLSISVAPGNLQPNTYTGTVTVTPNGGTAQVINVTLTVVATAVISATPTNIQLSHTVGGTSPTATIQVSGGGGQAGFTATAASSAGWLQVSPTTGTTPNTGTLNLTVSVVSSVLSTLNPNQYSGTVTVAAVSPATGSTIVNLTLTVQAPLPVITGVTNAASNATGPISPGEIISIYANPSNPIGPPSLNLLTLDATGKVATTLGGVQVLFLPIGVYAPLIFVNAGQINAVVPYEAAGVANLSVEVKYLGQTSNAWPVTLATTAPGIFTSNSSGTGQAAVVQYDAAGNYQGINSTTKPAARGWYLVIYMTGEGVVNPAAITGSVTKAVNATPPTPQPYYVPNVLIDGQPATVPGGAYGEAPGIVSGVLQVNVIVPQAARSGPVTLSVSLGTASTQAGVTVAVQ